eukprot:CAMPEP_0182449372 /NCGR_PEP_ID=MMETSP1172-20130603/33878_1 /TAXON_ID=708627 /ORGANISM="Timspurckia oligopyrenoides, Strain CCMP3278" /LENGTH=136 /DNA_ID=CAMNT_0024646633 /DNA_START=274 /DNA_END=684 /DNA_ORIENTATION=+
MRETEMVEESASTNSTPVSIPKSEEQNSTTTVEPTPISSSETQNDTSLNSLESSGADETSVSESKTGNKGVPSGFKPAIISVVSVVAGVAVIAITLLLGNRLLHHDFRAVTSHTENTHPIPAMRLRASKIRQQFGF